MMFTATPFLDAKGVAVIVRQDMEDGQNPHLLGQLLFARQADAFAFCALFDTAESKAA